MRRLLIVLAAAIAMAGATVGGIMVGRAVHRVDAPAGVWTAGVPATGRLMVVESGVDAMGEVERVDTDGDRTGLGVRCLRGYLAGARFACLRVGNGPTAGYEATVYDASRVLVGPVSGPISDADVLARIPLPGIPSRVRVSPSGRIVAWTTFVRGDSYAPGDFSTRTGIYDLNTGTLERSLETFAITVDGRRWRQRDANVWGVTLAADDRTFYATLASAGRTWLVQGDLRARTMTSTHRNVECPSLSPDGHRVAYKKRVGDVWRLTVLDLATGAETPLAEPASVDDQPAWLDDGSVVYARPARGRSGSDLWRVPADGTGASSIFLAEAASPAVIESDPGADEAGSDPAGSDPASPAGPGRWSR